MDKDKIILSYFPENIKRLLYFLSDSQWHKVNEICFISGQPISVQIHGKRFFVGTSGLITEPHNTYRINKNDVQKIYELITKSSAFAYNRFITNGFLTLEDGSRVGISGECVFNQGAITHISSVNALSFRISHNIVPNIDYMIDDIYSNGKVSNIIIISPPGCGKTTLLRGVASTLSRKQKDGKIVKCAIVDERYEIAACSGGVSTLNVGYVSSVISGCTRNIAIPMIVRSMSPDVILTDEIATDEDIIAIKYAKASGCSIIATTHGINEHHNELKFFDIENIFDKKIILSSRNGPGTIEKIFGGDY